MNLLELFAPVRTFVFDVDGVLTDGTLTPMKDGQMQRSINIKDVYALQLAIKKGYRVWLISGGRSEGVKQKLNMLGVKEVHNVMESKEDTLHDIIHATRETYHSVLYMGDDMPDYAAMKICGLPCCPNDAAAEIKQLAKYISPFDGGKGCVRDVIEKVLKLNKDWEIPA